MTYVIVEWCKTPKPPEKGGKPGDGTCYTNCVSVCPVDCIYPPAFIKDDKGKTKQGTGLTDADKQQIRDAKEMLYINPDECIDCGACEPECPVQAIFQEDEVPNDMTQYVQINKTRFGK